MTQVDPDACPRPLSRVRNDVGGILVKSASLTCRLVSVRSIVVDLRTTSRVGGQRMVSPSRLAGLDFTAWRLCLRDEGDFALALGGTGE